jgi:hypothetical protein
VIRRDVIEAEILTGLKREVIREDLAAFALEEFKRQLQARLNDTRSHLSVVRVKREKLKSEISNLAGIIASGHQSSALLGELSKREAQLGAINDELLAADGNGLDARFQEMESFVQKRLQDIRGLLDADVPRAKAELAEALHCNHDNAGRGLIQNSGGLEFTWRTFGWCRRPESNWLRPPFQGGALPLSYSGKWSIKCRGAGKLCQ